MQRIVTKKIESEITLMEVYCDGCNRRIDLKLDEYNPFERTVACSLLLKSDYIVDGKTVNDLATRDAEVRMELCAVCYRKFRSNLCGEGWKTFLQCALEGLPYDFQ